MTLFPGLFLCSNSKDAIIAINRRKKGFLTIIFCLLYQIPIIGLNII